MTGLATDVYLIICGGVGSAGSVVTLYDVGAMALSAATVPVVIDAGPVQGAVGRVWVLSFVDMVPPLTSLR